MQTARTIWQKSRTSAAILLARYRRGSIESRIIASQRLLIRSIARARSIPPKCSHGFHRRNYSRALKSSRRVERRLNETVYRARTSDHSVNALRTQCVSDHPLGSVSEPAFSSSSSSFSSFSSSTALGRPPLTFGRYKFVSLHHPLRIPFLQWVNCTLTLRAASDVSRKRDRYPRAELSIDPGDRRERPAGLLFSDGTHDPPRGRKQ